MSVTPQKKLVAFLGYSNLLPRNVPRLWRPSPRGRTDSPPKSPKPIYNPSPNLIRTHKCHASHACITHWGIKRVSWMSTRGRGPRRALPPLLSLAFNPLSRRSQLYPHSDTNKRCFTTSSTQLLPHFRRFSWWCSQSAFGRSAMHPGMTGCRGRMSFQNSKDRIIGLAPSSSPRPVGGDVAAAPAGRAFSSDGAAAAASVPNHVRTLYQLVREKMISHGGVVGEMDVQDLCHAIGERGRGWGVVSRAARCRGVSRAAAAIECHAAHPSLPLTQTSANPNRL